MTVSKEGVGSLVGHAILPTTHPCSYPQWHLLPAAPLPRGGSGWTALTSLLCLLQAPHPAKDFLCRGLSWLHSLASALSGLQCHQSSQPLLEHPNPYLPSLLLTSSHPSRCGSADPQAPWVQVDGAACRAHRRQNTESLNERHRDVAADDPFVFWPNYSELSWQFKRFKVRKNQLGGRSWDERDMLLAKHRIFMHYSRNSVLMSAG